MPFLLIACSVVVLHVFLYELQCTMALEYMPKIKTVLLIYISTMHNCVTPRILWPKVTKQGVLSALQWHTYRQGTK